MSELRVCANCGSPAVEFSSLEFGDARCKACNWSGDKSELIAVPMQVDSSLGGGVSEEEVLRRIYNDMRRVYRDMAQPLTQFLVTWGFVPAVRHTSPVGAEIVRVKDPAVVVKYVNRIFLAGLKAVFELREELEKDRVEEECRKKKVMKS